METQQPSPQRAIVFAGGDILTNPAPDADAIVIAADSGYDHAVGLGHSVDLLVGDLDSISDRGLQHAEAQGVTIDRHATSKDATDLDLALDAAVAAGVSAVDVYGGEAGRTDHLLGVAIGLTDRKWRHVNMMWHTATAKVVPVLDGGHVHVDAALGSVVSLIIVSDSHGITTQGLKWKLSGEDLDRGTSRSLSNEVVAAPVTVSLDSGALLVVSEPGSTP